jgi:hypothetical protein
MHLAKAWKSFLRSIPALWRRIDHRSLRHEESGSRNNIKADYGRNNEEQDPTHVQVEERAYKSIE